MREIKFRAWHTELKKMFSPEEMGKDQMALLPDGTEFWNIHGGSTALSENVKEMIPIQFTGLKDKNGVEIYEEDIVSGIWMVDKKTERNGVVRYYAKYGIYATETSKGLMNSLIWKSCEIIGNIYETPELLKST